MRCSIISCNYHAAHWIPKLVNLATGSLYPLTSHGGRLLGGWASLKGDEASHGILLGPSVRVQLRNRNSTQRDVTKDLLARYEKL